MFKFKINDTVKITAGKDKNQQGKIIKIIPSKDRVLVDGKNTYKKHLKAREGKAGEVVTLSRPLSVGSIALICPNCHQPTRVGIDATKKPKVRVCKKCHQVINITATK
ncbi:50S ribosomal protein L24 [Candidatus Collierbacteria bacterium]|nr:50S ribosomal protein L24 [Candidatus Collierbacteria bacterium]